MSTSPVAAVLPWIRTNLQSGPLGVVALTAIAATVQIPITQYRTMYCISVGYGLAVAAIGYTLRTTNVFGVKQSDPAGILALATIFYGLRLGGYLLLREKTRQQSSSSSSSSSSQMELSRPKRLGMAVMCSALYACMTTPLLYALRVAPTTEWKQKLAYAGAYMAWTGAISEALADGQKYVTKMRTKAAGASDKRFTGPTGGLFSITRHPNYTGEVMFWVGMFLTGAASFDSSVVGWIASILGLSGIVSIMVGATKRLEQRQLAEYGGQPVYEQWKAHVPASLIPFVSGGGASQ